MGWIDFALSRLLLATLLVALAFPLILALVARAPALRARNALQFLVSCLIVVCLWLAALLGPGRPTSALDALAGLLLLGSALLVYLEIWALLSRGYTLGLILTLFRAERPLDELELARCYRGGEGLDWIMRHRLAGLVAAGLVSDQGGELRLRSPRGLLVAWLYRLAIRLLGLRRTG